MPQFAVIVHVADSASFVVTLGLKRTTFGRLRWYSDVPLADVLVAKCHFFIDWDQTALRHELIDVGTNSLKVNGRFMAGAARWPADSIPGRRKGERTLVAPGDAIKIGEYRLEYIALD